MNIQPRIVDLSEKKLVGTKRIMTLANDQTFELWKTFMPLQKGIDNKTSSDFIVIEPMVLFSYVL